MLASRVSGIRYVFRLSFALRHAIQHIQSEGGHTGEAILLLSSLNFDRYTPRKYIVSEGDAFSAQKAVELESQKVQASPLCL